MSGKNTNENNDNGNEDRTPPEPGARWVEPYERSTGHVRGYWVDKNNNRIADVESPVPADRDMPSLSKGNEASSSGESSSYPKPLAGLVVSSCFDIASRTWIAERIDPLQPEGYQHVIEHFDSKVDAQLYAAALTKDALFLRYGNDLRTVQLPNIIDAADYDD